uniref:Uncharacterized protein n=1 Tax=Oryza glumipatula TaxID=40148 RepID=A0A0D9Y955_9ORYZ
MDANVVMAKPSTTRCSGIGPSSRCSFSVRLSVTLTCRGHLPRHPPVPDRLHHQIVPLGTGTARNQVAASGGFRHALKQAAAAASNSSFPAAAALKQAAAVANSSFPVAAASMSCFPAAAASMSSFPAAVAAATLKQATAAANSSFPAAAAASMSSFPATAAATAEFTSKSRRRRSRRRRWCRSIENPSASRVRAARPSLPIRRYAIDSEHPGVAWGSRSVTICAASAYGAGNSVAYHRGACFANDIVIVMSRRWFQEYSDGGPLGSSIQDHVQQPPTLMDAAPTHPPGLPASFFRLIHLLCPLVGLGQALLALMFH